jgi:RNA recognition motif-containing protein
MNIYVSNLSFNVKDEDLRNFFTPYGEVVSAKIITDHTSGQSRGFGFVEMADGPSAQKAIDELDQTSVDGRSINVVQAKPRESKPGFGSNSSSFGEKSSGFKKRW